MSNSLALIKQRTWRQVSQHQLSEHLKLSVHSNVLLSQSYISKGHTGEIPGSLLRPDLHLIVYDLALEEFCSKL